MIDAMGFHEEYSEPDIVHWTFIFSLHGYWLMRHDKPDHVMFITHQCNFSTAYAQLMNLNSEGYMGVVFMVS